MHSSQENSGMNSSLSDLLNGVGDDFDQPLCKEGSTIMTKDSMGSPQKSKLLIKKSKRAVSRKKKDDEGSENPLENSLSNLLESCAVHDDSHSGTSHGKRRTAKESPTVETMDSVQKAKRSSVGGDSSKSNSRRGAKKTPSSRQSSSLETSLSDLLTDPNESDGDDDDKVAQRRRVPRESGTLDSIQRHHKSSSGSGSGSGTNVRSKRGGKRGSEITGNGNNLSLTGGPAPCGMSLGGALDKLGGKPKDFGRQADDNDTFCGLGTVGEMEMKKAPLSKQSPRKDKVGGGSSSSKGKVAVAPLFGGKKQVAAPKPFMSLSSNNDDSDSDEDDLFQAFGANPFRTYR